MINHFPPPSSFLLQISLGGGLCKQIMAKPINYFGVNGKGVSFCRDQQKRDIIHVNMENTH